MKIAIIIPAHNEEENIENVVKSIERTMILDYDIIVVDDHSNDNTAAIVHKLCSEYKNLYLVSNLSKPGFANALKIGFNNANSDFVLPVMADSCDDPITINQMLEKAKEGYDIICGSRYMRGGKKIGGPILKSFFSLFFGLSLHLLIGIPIHDISNSFKLYRKKVIEYLNINSKNFDISVEIPLKAYFSGYRLTEVPTTWTDRKAGESKFKIFKQGSAYFKLYLWAIWKKILLR